VTVWKLADATVEEEEAVISLEEQDGLSQADPAAIPHVPHRLQIEDMIDAIQNDREPCVTGAEARKAVELVRAIYLSAKGKCLVHLPLLDPQA